MNRVLEYIFTFLVFPGFLFSAIIGLLAGWVDRKVTARIQWRVGPPWYQNFMDVAKLFLKETLVPKDSPAAVFLLLPIFALVTATIASVITIAANIDPTKAMVGDLIVVLYLLIIPSIALMLGGFFSGNPLASVGASREMKLILSYELPFILAAAVVIIKSGYALRLIDIVNHQAAKGVFISSASGVLAFLVILFSIQAKLGFVPFDAADAETEIIGGPYIEYSGKALGIWKLTKAVLTVGLPVLMITLLLGGIDTGSINGVGKGVLAYLVILVLMILIKNTNPRVRIDQALRFFWGPVTTLAAFAVILAYLGF